MTWHVNRGTGQGTLHLQTDSQGPSWEAMLLPQPAPPGPEVSHLVELFLGCWPTES